MKNPTDYRLHVVIFFLLLCIAMIFVSCSKDKGISNCHQVTIYMDSVYNNKVVSTFQMWEGIDCEGAFKNGDQLICDSAHVRRIVVK